MLHVRSCVLRVLLNAPHLCLKMVGAMTAAMKCGRVMNAVDAEAYYELHGIATICSCDKYWQDEVFTTCESNLRRQTQHGTLATPVLTRG